MKTIIFILLLMPHFLFAAVTVTTPVAGTASTINGSNYPLGSSYTPTANSLQIAFVLATGTIGTTTVMTGGGLTWVREATRIIGGVNEMVIFWAKVGGSPASTSINWDCTGDPATGSIISVFEFTGYDDVVDNPIRQVKLSLATTTSTNARILFDMAVNTDNGYAIGWYSNQAAASSTAPTGWTEGDDIAYINPATNGATAYRSGGETTAGNFTFTNTSSAWVTMGVEVYASGAGKKRGIGHFVN